MDLIISNPYWPFAILLIGIIVVVVSIIKFKFHPFIALMISAIVVGLLSPEFEGMEETHHLINAVELPMEAFGSIVGAISVVIVLAAIIGTAMMESGAATKIVDSLIETVGEKNGAIGLLISGFILSIPVFFDTVFFLIIPVIIAFAMKTKKNYVLYIMVVGAGAAVAHSVIPPTPGPLVVAETLQIDLGLTILVGTGIGILPAVAAYLVAKRINKKMEVPIRVEYQTSDDDTDVDLPPLSLSLMPIIVPIILISLTSVFEIFGAKLPGLVLFLGNKNIAMSVGAILAIWLWVRKKQLANEELWEQIPKPIQIAGIIILITGAGGAFGAMLQHSGIGDAIQLATADFHIHYVFLAWLISSAIKTAQGSATVALITTASIMYAIIGNGAELPYHPVYIGLAIGFGGIFISWMNDSGFWVVAKMSGMTEIETLKSFTVVLAIASLVGMMQLVILSYILPLR